MCVSVRHGKNYLEEIFVTGNIPWCIFDVFQSKPTHYLPQGRCKYCYEYFGHFLTNLH